MEIKKITIAGLGLIGGSLAKAFRRTNPGFTIVGVDSNRKNLELALEDGTVSQAFDRLEDAVSDSQVIFLCTPVSCIPELLIILSRCARPGTIITDVGSIKEGIMKKADELLPQDVCFIGGHPMAGAERSGYHASIAHLFENAYYILTPRTGTPDTAVNVLKSLIASTGAIPLILDPVTHDQMVGAVSHLPHIIAAALVNTVREADGPDNAIQKLAAGGFKDITRIASSNPEMWRDICLYNRDQLLPLISSVIGCLSKISKDLEAGDGQAVESFYMEAKKFRDQIPSSESLYLLPYYQVYVDVEDKPGIIGKVTTILGSHNVNIKNIRIINSREDEPGCLVLSLDDQAAQAKAVNLLNDAGCRAYIR
ncbi:MAG TPA: prephenate dehydrogenase [Clostridiales bacterium]|nr:prephenate dehydrogenase [Clostridiales bacterium]